MKKVIIPIMVGLLLIGCASTNRSGSTEESAMKDVPDWFLNPPKAEGVYYGVGSAKKQNPSLAKNAATARARNEIARAVEAKVSTMLKDFMQESGVGDNAQALEFTEMVTKQVSSVALKGSTIKNTYLTKDGTIYVLVEYPLNALRQATLNEAQKQEALYNEFKAKQGFNALEKAIENLE